MGVRNAILSTLALYKWDNSIFDRFRVPGDLVKQDVVDSILLKTAEMSVIYSSPYSLKNMIGLWTNKNFSVWKELWDTTQYEYNPIWNYDRTEESTDTHTGNTLETRDLTKHSDYERDLNDSARITTEEDAKEKNETQLNNQVAAFNEGLADSTASHQVDDRSVDRGITTNNNVDQTGTTNTTDTDEGTIRDDRDLTDKHEMRAYGNIGVTTTQDMINQQRELVQFNLIDYIVDDYMQNFCVMVY